jgi:ATP-dependent RNA helicase DDX20
MLKSKKVVHTKDIELNENVTFEDLMLAESVVSGLRSAGYIKPSPVQFKAIPLGKLGLGNCRFMGIKSLSST